MLGKGRETGAVMLCDVCQTEIDGHGLVLFKFNGQALAHVMVVHPACEQSQVVTMLMPSHRSMPLGLYLEQVLERVSI
jgi:hypothetical protein